MKEIKYLKISQVMIFPTDDIYFQEINNEPSIQKIISTFSLNRPPLPPQFSMQFPPLLFQNGIFVNNKKTYIIEQLSIEDRKITINMLSPSDISDLFFKDLKKLLISLDSREEKGIYEPLIRTYETTCVLKLDIKLDYLFSKIKFDEIKNKISENIITELIFPYILSPLDFKLAITMSQKNY